MLERTRKTKVKIDESLPIAPPTTGVVISPPNFGWSKVRIIGTAPLVMNKMSSANRIAMMTKQEEGSRAKKGSKREAKDFDKVYRGAMHISTEGWLGIPASAFRSAMISACSICGFHMTKGKKCLFVEADGIDADDGSPLVKIIGKPERKDLPVKLANGSTDIIARPFFPKWEAVVTIGWDADMFSGSDVANLLMRAGLQVGVGAGRPDSRNSCGCGWGTFRIADQ